MSAGAGAAPSAGAAHPPGTAGAIRLHRLVLHGFGPFRESVEVRFPDGLGVLVAPNEFGKSTIVAGIAAVLFGLPGLSNPRAFGQARYRNREGPARFEGWLEFTAADGVRYRLARNFEDHRVRVQRLDAGGRPTTELETTHNPSARRPNPRFEQRLQELVGMASRELFVQTFCIEQPLPDPSDPKAASLSDEVRRLLSGAGAGSYDAALRALLDQLRRLTRRKGELGVGSQNDEKEREVEALEARIAALEQAVAQGRQQADELEQVQRQLARLTQERDAWREQLRRAEQARQAWQEWRRLAEAYQARTRERQELRKSVEQARRLAEQVAEAERALRERWPELAGASEATRADLERLAAVEIRLTEARGRQQALEREADQALARAALAAWRRRQGLGRRLEALDGQLRDFDVFERADPDTLEFLRNHAGEGARLQARLRLATGELEQAHRNVRQVQEREAQLREAFSEVVALEPQVAAAIEAKLSLSERQESALQAWSAVSERAEAARQARLHHRRRVGLVAGVAAVLGAGIGLAAGRWMGWSALASGLLALALAAGLAVAFGLAARARGLGDRQGSPAAIGADDARMQALQKELAQLAEAMAEVDRRLGPLAGATRTYLAQLATRWGEWRRALEQLEQARRELPSAEALARLEREVADAQGEWERFEGRLRPFAQRFPDVGAAMRRWEGLRAARQAVAAELDALHAAYFAGPSVADETPCAEAGPLWAQIAGRVGAGHRSGQLADQADAARSVGDLVRQLDRLEPPFWAEPASERRLWDACPTESEAALAWLARMAEDQLTRARTLSEQAERARREAGELEAEASSLRQGLGTLLQAAGGDVGRALRRFDERAEHLRRLEADRQALGAILQAREAQDLDQLSARLDEAGDAAVAAWQALEKLASDHPGLPSPAAALNPAEAAETLGVLSQQVQALEAQLAEAERAIDAARARQAQLMGQQPLNVAAAELELAALRRRREELWLEAQALALAYRELEQAVQEFQASHRERLQRAAGAYFAAITGREGRQVRLNEAFAVSIVEPDGAEVHPSQVSKGAQDQLYLALRLAIADLMASALKLPFLLDDPFLNCDDKRLERIRQTLAAEAQERQLILLTHRAEFAAWGQPITCSVQAPARA